MRLEIYQNGNLIKIGNKKLGSLEQIEFDNELMYEPTCQLVLPIEWLDYFKGREEVKIFVNDKCFWGVVWRIEVDKINEKITLDIRHVISEWHYRQISVNHAISSKYLNVVYKGDSVQSNTANDESITAREFTVSVDEGKKLTTEQIKSRAMVQAWKTSNGDRVSVANVKIEKCETKDDKEECTAATLQDEGTYKVTFSTAKGTSISVEVKLETKYTPDYSSITSDPSVIDKMEDIYNDMNFTYPGWNIDILNGGTTMIDYVYSRQDKLEALTQTMELTDDLFWRVHFWNEKRVQIGSFGEKKPYIFSTKPTGETNIQIIEEPIIEYDFENVVNVATVYSDKSDSGMSSLTLREVYERPQLQKSGFPVVILHANVNNERDYSMYTTQYPKLAPNNELEYAVLDEESIALESGTLIEGTYAFNDLNPFEIDGEIVTDEKRILASETVYNATIRNLIQARRGYNIQVTTAKLPKDIIVGDKVRLQYDNKLWNLNQCSSYWKKILSLSDWWYITRIEYVIDEFENEINRVTLTKWLRIERETRNDR